MPIRLLFALATLFWPGASLAASPDARPRAEASVDVGLVLVPVVALDRNGRAVAGIAREEFRLRVDGRPTAIEWFEGGDAPLVVALAIDASASMVGARFEAARAAARVLIERLGPRDRVAILTFDHRARVATPLTSDRAELERGLERIATGGGTALYDALALGVELLSREHGRKALILLTDGEDTVSRKGPHSVERLARRSQVVFHAVSTGDTKGSADQRRLDALAHDLGGRSLRPRDASELERAYADLFEELRTQYTLGFTPSRQPDGRWHSITVELAAPDLAQLEVRARRGWLAERGAP